jgi:hypothetical protein
MIDGVSAGRDDGVCGHAGSQHPRAGLQAWRSHWMLVDQMEFHYLDWTPQNLDFQYYWTGTPLDKCFSPVLDSHLECQPLLDDGLDLLSIKSGFCGICWT